MSDSHADTIRHFIEADRNNAVSAIAALDALVAELAEARRERDASYGTDA